MLRTVIHGGADRPRHRSVLSGRGYGDSPSLSPPPRRSARMPRRQLAVTAASSGFLRIPHDEPARPGGRAVPLLVELLGALLDDRSWRMGVIGGLLFLTRVESLLLLGPLTIILLLTPAPRDEPRHRRAVQAATVWLAIVAAVTLARYADRHVLPNRSAPSPADGSISPSSPTTSNPDGPTFVVLDRGGPPGPPTHRSVRPGPEGICLLAVLCRPARGDRRGPRNAGDWMPQFRLLTPYVPLLASASGIAATGAWQMLRSRAGPQTIRSVGGRGGRLAPPRLSRPGLPWPPRPGSGPLRRSHWS